MEKICSKCKTPKPLEEFPKRKDGKYGYDHYCKECGNALHRKKYAQDEQYKDRAMRRSRKNRFKINDDELNLLLIKNTCAVCSNEFKSSKDKHIDHDHTTGKIRGILCSRCNRFLGFYELHPDLIKKFEHYLKSNG